MVVKSNPKPLAGLLLSLLSVIALVLPFGGQASELPGYLKVSATHVYQSLGAETYHVYDTHQQVLEEIAVGYPGLKVIRANDLFEQGTFFFGFGFGLPNFFMAKIDDDTGIVYKVDAKSLHRAPMKIVNTRGKVQSGVFIVPRGLSQKDLSHIEEIAMRKQGSSDLTCVHTNCAVLGDAGFTINDFDVSTYYLPHKLFKDLLRYGMKLHGRPISFDIINTTSLDLMEYYGAIKAAVNATPVRHAQRFFDNDEAKVQREQEAARIRALNEKLLTENRNSRSDGYGNLFSFELSQASDLGARLRRLWGAHVLYKVKLPEEGFSIDDFLPSKLEAFSQQNPGFGTLLKKNLLFSPFVVWLLHSHLAPTFKQCPQVRESFLEEVLPIYDGHGLKNKYNLVMTGKEIIIAKLGVANPKVDWALSKHVLIAGYSNDVRFAGEMWKDPTGTIWINNNSGTYRPSDEQLEAAVAMASTLFPHLSIEGEPAFLAK